MWELPLTIGWSLASQAAWAVVIKYLEVNVLYSSLASDGYKEHLWTVAAYGLAAWLCAVSYAAHTAWKRSFFLQHLSGDYVLLIALSLAFHGAFVYAISKTSILPVLLSMQLDSVFVMAANLVTGRTSFTSVALLAIPLVVGGFVVVTTLQWCTSQGWCISWSNSITSDVKGLCALFGARLAYVLRGALAHHIVLLRHSPQGQGQRSLAAQIDDDRHLFPDQYENEDRRLALDRVFGSGMFTFVMLGDSLRGTVDLHAMGEFLYVTPLYVIAAYFWPQVDNADHKTANDVWQLFERKWLLIVLLCYLMVAQVAEPLLQFQLSVTTSNTFFLVRQVLVAFVSLMAASVLFEDIWDRVKLSGAFLLAVGYGLVFYSIHTEWQRGEEDKDIEMIGASQGLSSDEIEDLKARHHSHKEDFRTILLKRVLSERRLQTEIVGKQQARAGAIDPNGRQALLQGPTLDDSAERRTPSRNSQVVEEGEPDHADVMELGAGASHAGGLGYSHHPFGANQQPQSAWD